MKPVPDIRTIKVRLNLTEEQRQSVLDTAAATIPVFNLFTELSCRHRSTSYQTLHKHGYAAAKLLSPNLPTGILQSVAKSACGCVRAWNSNKPKSKWEYQGKRSATASLPLDKNTFSRRGNLTTLSSVNKRIRIVHDIPPWFTERYPDAKVQAAQIKIYADNNTALFIQYRLPQTAPRAAGDVVGVDRGLYNLYTTSKGERLSSKHHIAVKRRYQHTRRELQQKGTRSARRRRKSLRGRETRFMRDVNHCASKNLAEDAAVKTYVLENLYGIRAQRRGRKVNGWISNWSFFEFETMLRYKCRSRGIEVVFVDPRYTSQKCSVCGVIDKASRVKSRYLCRSCGHSDHADTNAAINIRDNHVRSLEPEQGAFNRPYDDKSGLGSGPSIRRPRAGGS